MFAFVFAFVFSIGQIEGHFKEVNDIFCGDL